MSILGLDIGGANLKAATTEGLAVARAFEIWKAPEKLEAELVSLTADFPPAGGWAVTMTAELADCFDSKSAGVAQVLRAVQGSARGIPSQVWSTHGTFVSSEEAVGDPLAVAAANWHALAVWAAGHFQVQRGMLIDIGSTTTDIINLCNRRVEPLGLTDPQRLLSSELVYTGLRRTPVCSLAHALPYRGRLCPLAAEWFATTHDVYLVLGETQEEPINFHTADGRPATIEAARARLGRMLCCDGEEFSREDAEIVARYLADTQHQKLTTAVKRVCMLQPEPCRTVIISGSGSQLALRVIREIDALQSCEIICLNETLSPSLAESACAYAVACLAQSHHSAGLCGA